MNEDQFQQMIERAISKVVSDSQANMITRADVEVISTRSAEQAINQFCKRLGLDHDIDEWHRDRSWVRSRRIVEGEVVKSGIIATLIGILGLIGTAVIFYFRGDYK